jgi:hypothetical protein
MNKSPINIIGTPIAAPIIVMEKSKPHAIRHPPSMRKSTMSFPAVKMSKQASCKSHLRQAEKSQPLCKSAAPNCCRSDGSFCIFDARPSCAPAWRHGQGQALRVPRNLDLACRGRTPGAPAPREMSLVSPREMTRGVTPPSWLDFPPTSRPALTPGDTSHPRSA